MNKLISKNPVLRFKLGLNILKYANLSGPLTPIWLQEYEINFAPIKKGIPGSQNTRAVMQGAYNRAHPLVVVPYANANKSTVAINNSNQQKETLYSGIVWDYLNKKAKNFGDWTTNNRGNKFFTITNDDGTKYNVFGNGLMYDQNGKLVSTITELEVRNALNRNLSTRDTKASTKTNPKTLVITNATNSLNQTINNNLDILTPKEPIQSRGEIRINVENNPTGKSFNSQLAAGIRDHYSTPATVTNEGPSFYGEGLTDFNRGSIRGFRNLDGGFRNVDEYYTWLNNNQNSDQYKLWNNVLEGMDDETRRNTFYQIMNQFGISGNLGRRDSGRLAEVLNTLRDLGVNGSANLKAFMNFYNTALNNELTEGRRNASPVTSLTELLRNLTLNARPSLATAPYIVSPRYYEYPLIYKKGGLISKNPVEQFKYFRKGSTLTSLKTGGSIPKYQWGNTLIQSVENRRNQINNIANEASKIVATNIQSTKNQKSLLDKASAKPKKKGVGNYVKNTAVLLLLLWDMGAFKGVKDKYGREATIETAVDGIDGNMTLLALANAKNRGYGIDSKTGNIKIIKLKHQPTMEGDHSVVTYTPKNNLFTKTMGMFGNIYDFITGESADKNNYQNSKRYTSKVDWYKPYSSYDGYKSRLGDLGLVKGKDGTYKLLDKNGKLIDLCAQTTNSLLLMLRKHQNTIGDAWTSHGMYGDSMLINGYKYLPKIGTYNKVTHTLQNMAAAAAVLSRLKNLDLLTGDVVGLYSANSAHNDEAWAQGTLNRSNSHEGIVFRPYPTRKDLTYIIHNINGDISVDPISKFMVSKSGLQLDWAPTYVMRPNKGPEQKLNPTEKPLTYRISFDGKNFYDVLTTEGKKKYGLDIHSGKNYRLINDKPVAI